nr:ABC transporter permease [Actinoplanes teichomyceticus]
MSRARDLAAQERAVPSRERLRKALAVGWPKAAEVHERLLAEVAERRTARRRTLRSLPSRKNHRGGLRPRHEPLPAAPETAAITPPPERASAQVAAVAEDPRPAAATPLPAKLSRWPLLLLAAPAIVAIWAGWVDLGRLTGFGVVHPFPGIADDLAINTAITLPIGLETYAAYALRVWLSGAGRGRAFARWSAIGSLLLGFAGQAAYHLMVAAGWERAPWPITLAVSGVPVAVLGMGAALWHLTHEPPAAARQL